MISILLVNALLLPIMQVAEYFTDESMWRKKTSLAACFGLSSNDKERCLKVEAQRYLVNKIPKYNDFFHLC